MSNYRQSNEFCRRSYARQSVVNNSMQIGEIELLAVPEPSTLALAAFGLLGLALAGRRKR